MSWSWKLLRAGTLALDGGSMFGVVPRALWSRMVEPDEANRIPLQTNCLLLEDDQHRVLIEVGFGDKWTDKERRIYALERRSVLDALAEADVAPETIDHVVVTHLHFDHAGALTRRDPAGGDEPVPSFARARIAVQRTEWDDARANKSTMTRTYLASHLDPVADAIVPIDGELELLPGLWVFPLPGHTWGHQGVRFAAADAAGGIVCYPGDVMPTRNHVGLAYSMGYDMLPYDNQQTKQALLQRAADEDWRLVFDHEPGDPVTRVRAVDGGFALAPV